MEVANRPFWQPFKSVSARALGGPIGLGTCRTLSARPDGTVAISGPQVCGSDSRVVEGPGGASMAQVVAARLAGKRLEPWPAAARATAPGR